MQFILIWRTFVTPNLPFGGQVVSKTQAEERNDKKLIEQTNYMKRRCKKNSFN